MAHISVLYPLEQLREAIVTFPQHAKPLAIRSLSISLDTVSAQKRGCLHRLRFGGRIFTKARPGDEPVSWVFGLWAQSPSRETLTVHNGRANGDCYDEENRSMCFNARGSFRRFIHPDQCRSLRRCMLEYVLLRTGKMLRLPCGMAAQCMPRRRCQPTRQLPRPMQLNG